MKPNDLICHHDINDDMSDKKLTDKNNLQINPKLIQTADPLLHIQKERINMLLQGEIPQICFISLNPQKNDNFLIPIARHFLNNPNTPILSYYTIPTEPNNIYFECSDSTILLDNLHQIPELSELDLSVQIIPHDYFIQSFCNFNTLCYLKPGYLVQIFDPEFKNDFGQIISINYDKMKCLIKLSPRIDYEKLSEYQITSQIELNTKMLAEYQPPKSLFDRDKLISINDKTEFKTETIQVNDKIDLNLTIWDGKKFYGKFQYKSFNFSEIKTIFTDLSIDEINLFRDNIYLNENEIEGFIESFQKVESKLSKPLSEDEEEENFQAQEFINEIQTEEMMNNDNDNDSNSSSILSNLPKHFPQVSVLTNYITQKVPSENFVWLEKTDGLHNNIIIENNKVYSIVNGSPQIISEIELNSSEFLKRTILDTELYNGKYFIFDCAMIEGEDISGKFFKERMELAKQFIEKTNLTVFVMKEFYDIQSWKDLVSFVDKNNISPFTGNRIDGVVCQRIDKPYFCTVRDPGCFKLKRRVMTTTDFYLRYQDDEKRFYLYLSGNYKNYIYNLKYLPKNNEFMKKHTDVDTQIKELPSSFYILFSSPYQENLHLFRPRSYWSRNGYFKEDIDEIEPLMNDMMKDPKSYDKKIIEMSLADDGWVPMRIRADKKFANGYFFGVTNSSIIFSPVTGEESYFSKQLFFDTTITDPYHKINQIMRKYIIEHSINSLQNPRLNVLDLAGGRGADLLSLYHSGGYNIFTADADRNALVQYVSKTNNLSKLKWEKLRSSSVDLARNRKTLFLNAVYTMLGTNNIKYITDIKSRYEYPEEGFDVILMNYAIHYLCYNHECIRQLNRFIQSLLKPKGLFIFSCFDGDMILDDMRRNKNNEFELKLNSFNIKLLNDVSNLEFGANSDRDAKWANMALPTIDSSGYRPEPLVQRKWLRDLHLNVLEHYYPLKRCEKYIKDVENKEKVVDYLKYIHVYVMEK